MIRNQLEAVVQQLSPPAGFNRPGFLYGTAAELNNLLDGASFPVVMLYNLKPVDKQFTLSNAIRNKFSVYLEFLFKTEFDMYTSQNEFYIDLASSMCDEFLVRLSNYRETASAPRYFKIHADDGSKSIPVYNKMQANSTGVSLTISLLAMSYPNISLT